MMKYEVSVIDSTCKFYKLNDKNGKRLATIEFCGWKFYKYNVSFASIYDNANIIIADTDWTLRVAEIKEKRNELAGYLNIKI